MIDQHHSEAQTETDGLSSRATTIFMWFVLPGLLQGFGLYLLFRASEGDVKTSHMLALGLFLLVMPLAWFFTSREGARWQTGIFALILGIFCAGLSLLASATVGSVEEVGSLAPLCFFSSMLISYIAVPFYRTVFERKQAPNTYLSLFEFAWNMPVIIAGSLGFIAVVWGVLGLWAALFNLIGINFFSDLFFDEPFAQVVTCGAGALGIGILRGREGIVLALRGVLFALLKVLTPVVAVMTAMFAISAFAKGLDSLWDGWSATSLMVSAIVAAMVFTNATIADKGSPAHPLLKWSVPLQAIVLPVLGGFAVYGLWLRISEYGLTHERFFAALIVVTAAAYSAAYFISAIVPDQYRIWRQANIGLAGAIFVLAVLVQTPLLNAYQIAANNQVNRLVSGKVNADAFDFAYLKFDLGKAGKKAMAELRAMDGLQDKEIILAKLDEVEAAQHRYDLPTPADMGQSGSQIISAIDEGKLLIVGYDGSATVSDYFSEAFAQSGFNLNYQCKNKGDCIVARVAIFKNIPEQYLFISRNDYNKNSFAMTFISRREGESWVSLSNDISEFESEAAAEEFLALARLGQIAASTITLRAIKIGDEVFLPTSYLNKKMLEELRVDTAPATP